MEKITKKKRQKITKAIKTANQIARLASKGYLKVDANSLATTNVNDTITTNRSNTTRYLNVHRKTKINQHIHSQLLAKQLEVSKDKKTPIADNTLTDILRQSEYKVYQTYRLN